MSTVTDRLILTDAAIRLVDAGALPRELEPFILDARAGDDEALRLVAGELFTFALTPLGGPARTRFFAANEEDVPEKKPGVEVDHKNITYIPPGTPQEIIDQIVEIIINNDGEIGHIIIIPPGMEIPFPLDPHRPEIDRRPEIPPEIINPPRDAPQPDPRPQLEIPIGDPVPPEEDINEEYNAHPRNPGSETPTERIRNDRTPERHPLNIEELPKRRPLVITPPEKKKVPPTGRRRLPEKGSTVSIIGREEWKKIRLHGPESFGGFVDLPSQAVGTSPLLPEVVDDPLEVGGTPMMQGARWMIAPTATPGARPAARPTAIAP